jgi:rubredoxin
MAQTRFKCFACGKIYDDEESAIRCHNAPVQPVRKNEKASKPRFLGN